MTEYAKQVKELRKKQSMLTKKQMQEVHKIYTNTFKQIEKDIKKVPRNSLNEKFLQSYQIEIHKYLNELEKEYTKSVKSNMKKATVNGTALTDKMMFDAYKLAGIEFPAELKSQFAKVQDNVIKDIVKGNLYKDSKTLSERIWDFKAQNYKDIQYIIAEGIAQKKSARELATDLESYVKDPAKRSTTWGSCYPHLKNRVVDGNAMTLARTSINHAYQTATIQSTAKNEYIDGIEWQSALIPGRTCEICEERHGKIFKKNEVPLDHPNGLCTMLPHMVGSMEEVAGMIREKYKNKVK